MRKYLLPENGQFYKVNMHSHSTESDGKFTPEELKEIYKENGYSAFAYTEHNKLFNPAHLTDSEFVAITSYEFNFKNRTKLGFSLSEGAPRTNAHAETAHFNFFAKDPAKNNIIDISDIGENFCLENVNEAIKRAKAEGFIVVYNHPSWSLNTYDFYSRLEGVDGIEINNGASNRSSDLDYTPHVYNEMARCGKKMFCVGGDDNHSRHHFFTAWTMVKAESLTYENIINAIEKGDCYASDGPEIYELYAENGTVTVKCSEAAGVFLTTAGRRKDAALEEDSGALVTEATFKLDPEDICFRITVRDAKGKHANTNFYYLDEING